MVCDRWDEITARDCCSKDKYKQHNVTAVSHHQAATWVFSLKKGKKNLPLIDVTGAEIKTASLRWCLHSSTDSEVALTASEMVGVTQLHPVTAYGSHPKSALVRGPRCRRAAGCLQDVCLQSIRMPNAVRLLILPQILHFLAQKWLRWWAERALWGWHLGALCSTLQLCLTVQSWPPLPSWATLPLISQHFP